MSQKTVTTIAKKLSSLDPLCLTRKNPRLGTAGLASKGNHAPAYAQQFRAPVNMRNFVVQIAPTHN
jgi:hypothetical protein